MRRVQAAGGAALNGPNERQGTSRRLGILLGIAGAVYVADVISKVVVVAALPPPHQIRLLGGFLTLMVLRNSGAAFSIGTSMTIVFTLIAVGVIFFILRTSRRLRSLPWAITLGLLLGGATGNLTDRLLRAPAVFRGDVVDWIQLPHWPVFNLADSAIVCGGALAVLLAARGIRLDGTREGHPGPGDGGDQDGAGEDRADDRISDDGPADGSGPGPDSANRSRRDDVGSGQTRSGGTGPTGDGQRVGDSRT